MTNFLGDVDLLKRYKSDEGHGQGNERCCINFEERSHCTLWALDEGDEMKETGK